MDPTAHLTTSPQLRQTVEQSEALSKARRESNPWEYDDDRCELASSCLTSTYLMCVFILLIH